MCSRTYWLAPLSFILLFCTLLSGCDKPNKVEVVRPKTEIIPVTQIVTKAEASSSALIEDTNATEVFAPTVESERLGNWLGGAPPHNKRASGVLTYYRIKAADKPNHLIMTLRFEGIVADDAKIVFRPIDGAKFAQTDQPSQWRLTPNMVSEITFTVVVPNGISYLALDTFQNNQGASRAFLLETSRRTKQ